MAELQELVARSAKPDTVEWVKTGQTVAEHWDSLDTAGRRDWLKERDIRVTAIVRHYRWKLLVDWWPHKEKGDQWQRTGVTGPGSGGKAAVTGGDRHG